MAGPSNTRRRYLATKTKYTCRLKTQSRPWRISLSAVIGQVDRSLVRLVKAYRFRLEPTPTVAREMGRVAGCCRFVFNPRFKKKGRHDAFRYPDPKQFAVDDGHGRVKLPKLGWVRYRKSRSVSGTPKQLTISRQGGHWFVSIQTEQEVATPIHPANSGGGLDVGVAKFVALSTGDTFAPVSSFRKYEKKLAREQRKLARKVKYSQNWRKQKARIAKLHEKIARIRNDFLHKTSTTISKTHAMIVLEDLSVRSMSRSARGTVNDPRRNVRAKAGLNKSILDQGWAQFRRQLEYKQVWRGGIVVAVDPRNTSRTCPCCGHVSAENRKTQAVFRCVRCDHAADADVNAAHNILAAGHAVIACGKRMQSGPSMKQEPSVSQAA